MVPHKSDVSGLQGPKEQEFAICQHVSWAELGRVQLGVAGRVWPWDEGRPGLGSLPPFPCG